MRKVDTGTLAQRIGQRDPQSSLKHGFEVLRKMSYILFKSILFFLRVVFFLIFMGKTNENADFMGLVVFALKK